MRNEAEFLQEVIQKVTTTDKIRGLCHHFGEVCDGEKYSLELLDKYLDAMPNERYDKNGLPDKDGLNKFPHGKGKSKLDNFYKCRIYWLMKMAYKLNIESDSIEEFIDEPNLIPATYNSKGGYVNDTFSDIKIFNSSPKTLSRIHVV